MIVGSPGPATASMRAAAHSSWGAPLTMTEMERPEPSAGEVRVRMRATSVNPIDMYTGERSGYAQSMRLPFVPGWDVAGVVDALGYGVTRHGVGDRVFGLAWFPYPAGSYAEYVTVPAYQLVPVPASTSFEVAGCLPMAALTAWQMLEAADASAGRRVLISGASGGVGHLAVQLAAERGAEVVALARPEHHAWLRAAGAGECIDYDDTGRLADVDDVDALIELVGHDLGRALLGTLARGGRAALSTAWSVPTYRDDAERRGATATAYLVEPDPRALEYIAAGVDASRLSVRIGARYTLDTAAEAQRWVAERRGPGKVAIAIGAHGAAA